MYEKTKSFEVFNNFELIGSEKIMHKSKSFGFYSVSFSDKKISPYTIFNRFQYNTGRKIVDS